MRLIHVLIPDERRGPVLGALDSKEIDYAVLETDERTSEQVLVEFPLPSDGVGDVMDALNDAGLEEEKYTVMATAETASTPNMERLENRYSDDFDPLTRKELRSKARDMAHDRTSFVWMIFLSAIIATAGLLLDSPAIVVGSMVIAPMVGPVLTASVGAVTGDREMLADSIKLQAIGLGVAVVSALAFGYILRTFSFVPQLRITALGQISSRVAPSLLTVAVGLAAGSASAFGLTTKGPTSLIGVMIAAALIPAAATAGIAIIWGFPIVAAGSLVLLLVSLIGINAAAFTTLRYLGYRPNGFEPGLWQFDSRKQTATVAVGVAVLLLVVGVTTFATYQQITYQQTINREVSSVLQDPAYANLTYVQTSTEYAFSGGLLESESVTVTISRTSDREYPELANRLQQQLNAATSQNPSVRVHFVDYETANTTRESLAASPSAAYSRSSKGSSGSYPTASTASSSTPSTFSPLSTLM
ncbi:TIGR00341 family protein [Halorussus sp. MSC15.2]|uniref:TIGR00341 family protein n=1 Tax=Halorussus sp. MSC15.2 TaxID=2283638 RepID=UPI0013D05023|nr:TIGR00341 family protein [Halorussus sp. MSC15.2]NEU58910.1 TIGR00341 family protein [Halorussus sp. MSC15.2]